jgi:N-acetylneuraminic acid mutarotase
LVFTGKIYVTGGYGDGIYLDSAEMYDTETNQWTFVSPMLSIRSGHSCITFDDSLYAIGKYLRLFE